MRKAKTGLPLCLLLILLLGLWAATPAQAADSGFVIEDGVLMEYNGPGGSVTVPSGVKSIYGGAFLLRDDITSVTLPEGLTSIGAQAFAACSNLTTVHFPSTLQEIDGEAFASCSSLKSADLPYGLTSIGFAAFGDCAGLERVSIPGTLTVVGQAAFENCTSLKTLVIPEGVTELDLLAFSGCTGLTELSLPATLTSIGRGAFSGCESLRQVDLPSSVTFLGAYAFGGTPWQASLGDFAVVNGFLLKYQGTASDVTVPSGVRFVVGGAFSGNLDLTRVTLPAGVTFLGESAFYGCWNLTQATLPDGLVTIDDGAFMDCWALRSVNFPQGLTTIGMSAFRDCNALESAVFPSTLTTIETWAFLGCDVLQKVYFSQGAALSIGDTAFSGCTQLSDVTIPDSTVFIDAGAFSGTAWLKQQEDAGVEFILGGRVLIEYNGNGGNVTIPSNVWRIAYGAFSGHTDVTDVTIPAGVFAIDQSAFSGCTGLTRITIPEGVTEIGDYAFSSCKGLTKVTIPEGVTSLGKGAFYRSTALRKVELPTTLISIGGGAFFNSDQSLLTSSLYAEGKYSKVTLYGYTNSYSEYWAKSYNFKFVSVGKMTPVFTDVAADSYCAQAVAWAVEQEITTGTYYATFSPDTTCSTGQILTFLYRASGSPFVSTANSFTDVSASAYYYDAARWAKEMNMASGTTLNPDQPCTRASTVWFLWKAAGSPAVSTSASFADVPASSDYATAVAWAVENGVTSGTGNDCFSPDAICSRGQIVTFLYRAFQNQALTPARNIYQRVVPDNFTAILRDNGVVLTRNDGLPDVDYVITVDSTGTVTVQETAGFVYSEETYDGCILTDTQGNIIFTTES